MIRIAALLLCAVTLAACGSVPQPFRGAPNVTRDNPLIDVPAAMGVEVLPVSGLTPELSARLTRAVADRLMDLDILAEPVPHAGGLGFQLTGRASTGPGGEQFDVTWTLRSRRGRELRQFNQTVRVPPDGAPMAARETAEQVAATIGLSAEPGVAPVEPGSYVAKPALPTISVRQVEGAPGDGKESLRLAVLQALTDAGFKRDDADPDRTITATFTAKAHDSSSDAVVITWRVMTRDGRELGHLDLDNIVPKGALERIWGPTAFAIAAAAQVDLVRLLTPANTP